MFDEMLLGRRRPTYVAFGLLIADGVDLRPLSLRERKVRLARIDEGAEGWIARTNGLVGEGRALYWAVAHRMISQAPRTLRWTTMKMGRIEQHGSPGYGSRTASKILARFRSDGECFAA
jgi:hypothetical protein